MSLSSLEAFVVNDSSLVISREEITLGSGIDADLQIGGLESNEEFRVFRFDGDYAVAPVSRGSGIHIDGRPLAGAHRIGGGELLELRQVAFRFHVVEKGTSPVIELVDSGIIMPGRRVNPSRLMLLTPFLLIGGGSPSHIGLEGVQSDRLVLLESEDGLAIESREGSNGIGYDPTSGRSPYCVVNVPGEVFIGGWNLGARRGRLGFENV